MSASSLAMPKAFTGARIAGQSGPGMRPCRVCRWRVFARWILATPHLIVSTGHEMTPDRSVEATAQDLLPSLWPAPHW